MGIRPTGFRSGDWLIRCDTCGFIVLASQTRKQWDGAIVCHPCFDPRHPQEILRTTKDRIVPPFIRPEEEGVFPPDTGCSRSARCGFAIADCAVASTI